MGDQLRLQPSQIDVAVGVFGDGDHVADRFAPRDFVGVMLERSDEDHRPFGLGDAVRQVIAVVEIGRQSKVHDADQLVDRPRCAGPAEDHATLGVGADGIADDATSVLAQTRRLQPGAR